MKWKINHMSNYACALTRYFSCAHPTWSPHVRLCPHVADCVTIVSSSLCPLQATCCEHFKSIFFLRPPPYSGTIYKRHHGAITGSPAVPNWDYLPRGAGCRVCVRPTALAEHRASVPVSLPPPTCLFSVDAWPKAWKKVWQIFRYKSSSFFP